MYRSTIFTVLFTMSVFSVGCSLVKRDAPSPVDAGYNTRDLIDPSAQSEALDLVEGRDLDKAGDHLRDHITEIVRKQSPEAIARPPRHVLCMSGGGSYGAFTVGVLYGWTKTGERPRFDVVTGISTGALIAPLAFLGPEYDETLREFYTELEQRDVYRRRPVRGLFSDGLADNAPLAERIDEVLTPALIAEIAAEHNKGRRLYVGTTELEGRRLIIWDIGAIAQCGHRDLIKQVLLGSSAIPGFFPPARIEITVDGERFEELHGDGGVSAALFFRAPWLPEEQRSELTAANLYGTEVWCVVAGKLYADPVEFTPRALRIAANSVSTVLYAQIRGDLNRIYNMCLLNGMKFRLTSIPAGYPAPQSSTEFEPEQLRGMFDEGVRITCAGKAWRDTPPGFRASEADLERAGTDLIYVPRGPRPRSGGGGPPVPFAPGRLPIPVIPGEIEP